MTDSSPARARTAPAPDRPGLRVVPPLPDGDTGARLPTLRLLPAPESEPPYDDGPGSAGPRQPALRRTALRLVPDVRAEPPRPVTPPAGHGLPSARPFAVALVHRLLEVRGGARPVLQLQRDTTPGLYADLERALRGRARAAARPGTPPVGRPVGGDVRSVHVQEHPDGVAEVCATVRRGERMAALALRLEAAGGRWLCTQVQGL